MPITRLSITILLFIATRGPVAWAANWNNRATSAWLREVFDERPMTLRDVLPWATGNGGTPAAFTPDTCAPIPPCEQPSDAAPT